MVEPLEVHLEKMKDERRSIATIFIIQGSSLCPLGQAVMGGAFSKSQGEGVEGKVLADGRVIPPTPAQQALSMKNLDIYNWDPNQPHSDDEALSDLE